MSGTTSLYERVYAILDRHPVAGFDCGEKEYIRMKIGI